MKPLPRWLGWISTLLGLFAAGGGLAGVIPPKYSIIATVAAKLVNAVSEPLVGGGGIPK